VPDPAAATKSWARKRRFRPATVAAVRNDAATSIADASQFQKRYYERMLAMAEEKHAAEMRVLELKERLLKKQLCEE